MRKQKPWPANRADGRKRTVAGRPSLSEQQEPGQEAKPRAGGRNQAGTEGNRRQGGKEGRQAEGGGQRPAFERLLNFASSFGDGFERQTTLRHDLVDRPMDSTREGEDANAAAYTPDEDLLQRHCGEIMRRFDYQ